ncbi:MAG: hypothetical protein WC509_03400 [Candidatus Izemoplasmatales bacterium]
MAKGKRMTPNESYMYHSQKSASIAQQLKSFDVKAEKDFAELQQKKRYHDLKAANVAGKLNKKLPTSAIVKASKNYKPSKLLEARIIDLKN